MTINEKVEALEGAIDLVEQALELIQGIAHEEVNFGVYVYAQLKECLDNSNPYNQSLRSVLRGLEEQSMEDYG